MFIRNVSSSETIYEVDILKMPWAQNLCCESCTDKLLPNLFDSLKWQKMLTIFECYINKYPYGVINFSLRGNIIIGAPNSSQHFDKITYYNFNKT